MTTLIIRAGALVLLFVAQNVHAVVYLDQIERLGAVYSAMLDYRPGALPGPRARGTVELGLELEPVPRIDNHIGAKNEPVDAFPVIGRGRLHWSPVSGLRLGGYAVPPIRVKGSTARLWGVDAEYGWAGTVWRRNLRASTRLYHTQGNVQGAFSGPGVTDEFRIRNSGGDVRVGLAYGSWTTYGGLGRTNSWNRFVMGADGAVIDGWRYHNFGFLGLGWSRGPWTAAFEQHQTQTYFRNFLLTLTYGF